MHVFVIILLLVTVVKSDCIVPFVSSIESSDPAYASVPTGRVVRFGCNDPFLTLTSDSNEDIVCLSTGAWSTDPKLNRCEFKCGAIGLLPANIDASTPDWIYNQPMVDQQYPLRTLATIKCADGLMVYSDDKPPSPNITVECFPHFWAPVVGKCESECNADKMIFYRSDGFSLPNHLKPRLDRVEDVEEEECMNACRDNREPKGTVHRSCKSAEYHKTERWCYSFPSLPTYQENNGDGSDEGEMNKGKSHLTPTEHVVFFEKACVDQEIYDLAACSRGIIDKRPQLEVYGVITGKRYSDLPMASCLLKCSEYNLEMERPLDEQCISVNYEHRERYRDEVNGIPVPSRDIKFSIKDTSTCVLATRPQSRLQNGQKTIDFYYDPVADDDPWRMGRWDSYSMPKCNPVNSCPHPQVNMNYDRDDDLRDSAVVSIVYTEISMGSLDFDLSFPEGTRLRIYCPSNQEIVGVSQRARLALWAVRRVERRHVHGKMLGNIPRRHDMQFVERFNVGKYRWILDI